MYKVTVFEKDQDTTSLTAYVNTPTEDITIHYGIVVFHDVDDEYLMVPTAEIGHVSVVKDELADA